ncbi:MAG: thioredoxin domain-containing protein [Minisyncoccia bacterium]
MIKKDNPLIIPLSIIIAGGLIAFAIYLGGKNSQQNIAAAPSNNNQQQQQQPSGQVGQVEPVTSKDNIVGNPNAKIVIVEYSDYECPFCKSFHNTMLQVMNAYKPDEVAWVYRQFPIAQLHSKAPKESEAALCVNELGGNKAFWDFTDKLFSTTNSGNTLDESELPKLASFAGVNVNAFNSCLSSGKFTKAVQDDVTAAGAAGAQGTPFSVIITKSGNKSSIYGAQPFEQVKATIDALLK